MSQVLFWCGERKYMSSSSDRTSVCNVWWLPASYTIVQIHRMLGERLWHVAQKGQVQYLCYPEASTRTT